MASLLNSSKYSESEYKGLLKNFLKNNSYYNAAICYNDLGNIYLHEKKYIKAVFYYKKALATSSKLQSNKVDYIALNNMGTAFREQGKFKKAIKFYEKSLDEKKGYKLALLNLEFTLMNICDWRQIKNEFKTPFMSVITEDDPYKNFQTSKRFTKQS